MIKSEKEHTIGNKNQIFKGRQKQGGWEMVLQHNRSQLKMRHW